METSRNTFDSIFLKDDPMKKKEKIIEGYKEIPLENLRCDNPDPKELKEDIRKWKKNILKYS